MKTPTQELNETLNKMFKTVTSVHVGRGSAACFMAHCTSYEEGVKIGKFFEQATGVKSKVEKKYKEIDVFDEAGELIDIIDTDEYINTFVSCMFGTDFKKNTK